MELLNVRWQKWMLFSFGAAVIFLRCPRLFFEPRFWAEEGTVIFRFAATHSAWETLFRPDGGNLDLPRNLTSILSAIVPLEWAPLVTTLFGFFSQLVPLVVILTHSSRLLNSTLKQAIAIALYLFASTSEEIWLSSLHAQRFFALGAFLILLDEADRTRPYRTWFYRVLLLVGGLSGPETILLAPMFVAKCWLERDRENVVHAGIVSLCGALQFIVFLLTSANTGRFYPLDFTTFSTIIWTKTIMLPVLGGKGIYSLRYYYLYLGRISRILLGVGLLLAEIGLLYALIRRLPRRESVLVIGSFVLTVVVSIKFMVGDKTVVVNELIGNRYFYAPNFMLGLLLLANIDFKAIANQWQSKVFAGLLAVVLFNGAMHFWPLHEDFTLWDISWRKEIAIWRQDPSHPIRIWPKEWVIYLDRERQ